jgi:hypothetical protein
VVGLAKPVVTLQIIDWDKSDYSIKFSFARNDNATYNAALNIPAGMPDVIDQGSAKSVFEWYSESKKEVLEILRSLTSLPGAIQVHRPAFVIEGQLLGKVQATLNHRPVKINVVIMRVGATYGFRRWEKEPGLAFLIEDASSPLDEVILMPGKKPIGRLISGHHLSNIIRNLGGNGASMVGTQNEKIRISSNATSAMLQALQRRL